MAMKAEEILAIAIAKIKSGGGGGGGTTNYNSLDNKPQINDVELVSNKSLSDLGIASESEVAGLSSALGLAQSRITNLQELTLQLSNDKADKSDLGTASAKNAISVVTDSSNLVESGAVENIIGWGNKNLADISDTEIGIAWNGNANTARARLIIPIESSNNYTLSVNGTNNLDGIYICKSTSIPAQEVNPVDSNPYTIEVGVNDKFITIGFNKNNITLADIQLLKIQLEKGSTATAYKPYHASVDETIPQEISDAVGWDVGNLITGVVENYSIIADGTVTPDNTFMHTNGSIVKPYHNYRFKAQSTDTASSNIRIHGYNSSGTWVKQITAALGVTTTADIKFYIDDPSIVSVKISLKKAFTEYTLTHFTVDEQKADNSVIAPIENGTNASQAWSVGQHFIRNGKFCTVTQAISSGGTLTEGTNYTAGDVASEFDAVSTVATLSASAPTDITLSTINTVIKRSNFVDFKVRINVTNNLTSGNKKTIVLPYRPHFNHNVIIIDSHSPYPVVTTMTAYINTSGEIIIVGELEAGLYDLWGTYICQ